MIPLIARSSLPASLPGATPEQSAERLRQKRRQVARACDGCRLLRIKCDNGKPCSNCKRRGQNCSHEDVMQISTLSKAQDEIGHLRQQVQELQSQLDKERSKTSHDVHQNLPIPPVSSSALSQDFRLGSDGNSERPERRFWEGIQLRPARSSHDTWFGPSSLYFFIKRLSLCLGASIQQSQFTDTLRLNSSSSRDLLDGPTAIIGERTMPRIEGLNIIKNGPELTPTQEDYFISFFWESYHTSIFAIIDEAEFKKHHQSLWMCSGKIRKPSALVDIVLAMCMQYGISKLPVDQQADIVGSSDATIAGRWHYRRCQTLLAYEMESPTISTLQCHLLCAIYLCGGSFHNMVDSSCGLAVRTAYMLGLHLDPPSSLSLCEQEKRRRLWWAVYLLDSKSGMKLGRPFLLHDSQAMPRLPGHDIKTAAVSGSTFAPIGDNVTWLSFNLHSVKLYMTVRAAYTAFYAMSLHLHDTQTLWDNSQVLEACAKALSPYTMNLKEWASGLPDALKTKRQNNGRSFSTDGSALDIEQFAPLWLQRQRLLIELTYHHLCVNLYRVFISLGSAPTPGLLAEEMAMICAAHAVAFTKIAHQVLSSTSILEGWHEVFQCQWSAVMTLVGFVFTYPQSPSTPAARSAIDLSIVNLDICGNGFAVAAGAANIVRNLCIQVDLLGMQSRPRQGVLDGSNAVDEMSPVTNFGTSNELPLTDNNASLANPVNVESGVYDMNEGYDLFDTALAVDFWGDYHTLWPNQGILP